MIAETLESISTTRTEIEGRIREILGVFSSIETADGGQLEIDSVVPNSIGSISDILMRLESAVGLTKTLDEVKNDKLMMVPKNQLTNVHNHMAPINQTLQTMLDEINNTINSGGIQRIDKENIHIINQQNEVSSNVGAHLKNIDDNLDGLLFSIYQVNSVVKAKEVDPFSSALKTIQALTVDLQKGKQELSNLLKTSKTFATKTESSSNAAETVANDLNSIKETSIAASEIIKENEGKANELIAAINAVNGNATQLKETIDQFQETFIDFQQKLDSRNESFESGKKALESLINESGEELKTLIAATNKLRESIAELEADGKRMLGLTTAAGLAQSFHQARAGLKFPLRFAQAVFYFSIALLLVLAGAMLNAFPWLTDLIALPPVRPPAGATTGSAILHIFGSVLVRFIILLPGLLLAAFAVRWHRSLFRLREDYLFKETVAASVPGFKEEAPQHAQAIAAAAFEHLLFNPADRIDREEKSDRQRGFLSRWLKQIVKEASEEMKKPPTD